MQEWIQILLVAVLSFYTAGVVSVMVCCTLIFPVINWFFNCKLPIYSFSLSGENPLDGYFFKKPVIDDKIILKTTTQAPARFVDVHKDIETVRLPPVIATQNEGELTAVKIDAAAKGITRVHTGKTKVAVANATEPKKPKETAKPETKRTKKKAEAENIATVEIPVVSISNSESVKTKKTAKKAMAKDTDIPTVPIEDISTKKE